MRIFSLEKVRSKKFIKNFLLNILFCCPEFLYISVKYTTFNMKFCFLYNIKTSIFCRYLSMIIVKLFIVLSEKFIFTKGAHKKIGKKFSQKKKKKIFSVEGEYKMWELHVAHSFVSFSHKILVLKLQITTTTRARNVNDVKSLPFTFPLIRKKRDFLSLWHYHLFMDRSLIFIL